jgi:hypothetical protein
VIGDIGRHKFGRKGEGVTDRQKESSVSPRVVSVIFLKEKMNLILEFS